MSSWVSEASLSVQALAKKTRKPNTLKAKLIATKEVSLNFRTVKPECLKQPCCKPV